MNINCEFYFNKRIQNIEHKIMKTKKEVLYLMASYRFVYINIADENIGILKRFDNVEWYTQSQIRLCQFLYTRDWKHKNSNKNICLRWSKVIFFLICTPFHLVLYDDMTIIIKLNIMVLWYLWIILTVIDIVWNGVIEPKNSIFIT